MQAGLQHRERAVAEQQPARVHGRVFHDDFVGGVEGAEFAGEFVEVEAEKMRAQRVGGERHGVGKLDELPRQRKFLRGLGRARAGHGRLRGVEPGLAENAADAGDGVKQVGGRIALERDHPVPREDVVAGAVLREVGVLHGGHADDVRDGAALGLGEIRVLRAHEREGAVAGLAKQVLQAEIFAAAGLERLVVLAEYGAEVDVLELWQLAAGFLKPFFRGEEELVQVVTLAEIDDVDRPVHLEVVGAVKHGGEVAGGVVGGAVLLADHEGLGLEPGMLGVEDDERPLAFLRETAVGEFTVDPLDLVIVETLAERDVELDAELVVDELEGGEGGVVDLLPDSAVPGVAGLELDEFLLGLGEHGRVGLGGMVAELVETLELLEGFGDKRGRVEVALVGPDEFAELRAPVANVVVANHLRTAEGEEPADGLANDSRTQVADVHLLCRVGRRIVHDPGLALAGAGRAGLQVLLRIVGLHPAEQGSGLEAEVDEPRASQRYVEMLFQAV